MLAWRLSNTMDAGFCVAALDEALARFGKPEIFDTGQGAACLQGSGDAKHRWKAGGGSQFTSAAFTSVHREAEVRISMDGRGRWMDKVFIERLWCSLR